MGNNYIPGPDGSFDAWFNQFNTYFQANHLSWGFVAADATALQTAFNNWRNDYNAHNAAQAAARGAAQSKRNRRQVAERVIRPLVKRLHVVPVGMSDAHRGNLGIALADRIRTASVTPIVAPSIELDWSQRGQCIVHVGTVPTNENINKFSPHGKNVVIHFRVGGGDWQYLGVTSKSPFVHVVGNTEPQTIEYRAAYLNSKGEQGPWSEFDSAYIANAA